MKRWFPSVFLFLFGGGLYYLLEILWRGYSHWTMFFAGGTCFLSIDWLNNKLKKKTPLWVRCTLGAAVITGVEFIIGCTVNLWAHWNVWDYSRFRFHFMGQICLLYTFIWFFLTAPLIWLTTFMRHQVEHLLNKIH
ncbi:MAG: hypothetical protein RR385_00275 [Clostridiales bacterium]